MLRYNQRYLFCIRATSSFTHFKQAYKIFVSIVSVFAEVFFVGRFYFVMFCNVIQTYVLQKRTAVNQF